MSSFEEAREKVLELVRRFDEHREAYRKSSYNEAQVRQEFVNPFFEALGWDVGNKSSYAEQYKDVVHEDSIKIGISTKAPDYSFRIGGVRKFFLEAKKPSVYIKGDPASAYQLRRYAWSAKLPLSVLTDFEEFAVYDCRVKPQPSDGPAVGRVKYVTFDEYPEKFREIYDVFARESVLKGSFDRYAEGVKGKRGTGEVDAEFLKEIEGWRLVLAKDLAKRNPALNIRELNFSVQQTIDRIVFLRIAEDRGVEPFGSLQTAANGANVYRRLVELYDRADAKYNSGLFDFKSDRLSHTLDIDGKVLKEIIGGLYYPRSPYEFSVIGAEILGNVYEQFLGKVIRLTAGHQAKVEDKPEVKKAGGVYYTPGFVVDYIVKNTLGVRLEGMKPKQAEKLKVLDPACGSGSFLLRAYQYLLDWHRDLYVHDGPEKYAKGKNPVLFQGRGGEWRLSTSEKKRILLNNIFGVDIDRQAVEVTKLSLLLKVLEGESEETLKTLNIFGERALPSLEGNIKCGNSLIGSDFYSRQGDMFGDEDTYRINAFDWQAEFRDIMKAGGFDCVIGNPPYVRQEMLSEFKPYFQGHYKAYNGVADLYVYFIEKGISLLCPGGLLSIIVSSGFLRATFAGPLRQYLVENSAILQFIDFGGLAVFEKAKDTYVCIPLFGKREQPKEVGICKVDSLENVDLSSCVASASYAVPATRFVRGAWPLDSELTVNLFEKIKSESVTLEKYVERRIYRGVLTGLNEAFVIDAEIKARLIQEDPKSAEIIKPFLGGQDIKRYSVVDVERYLIFTRRGIDITKYTAVLKHLKQFKNRLMPKPIDWQGSEWQGRKPGAYQWYEIQDSVDYYEEFEKPKIIYPDIAKGPRFFLDTSNTYITNTAYCLGTDDKYLLGILNSKISWFLISCVSIPFGTRAGEFRYRLIYQYMSQLPIRPIDFDDPKDKARHDRMVSLVTRILDLNKRLADAKTPADQDLYKRQVDSTDREIDSLVYELYGLTEEEKKLLEDNPLATIHKKSKEAGLDKITDEEIEAEVKAVRLERAGSKKKT